MRDIKFRVWDEVQCFSLSEAIFNELVVIQHNREDCFAIESVYGSVIIEQYTGLKDKNGVDIYEGDIVMCYPEIIELCYTKVVEWDIKSPSLGITTNGRSGATLCDNNQDILLVIGNIHQNPELLE